MKFKREYLFGGDKKNGEDDYVIAYIAENGMRIECMASISNNANRWYEVNGQGFDTLKDAKAFCEATTHSEKGEPTMMNKNNTYFENLYKLGCEWEAARAERQARKQPIIDTYGWESEELKAWYAEDKAAAFPFEQGTSKAYRAWKTSIRRQEEEIEMEDFLWDREVKDFVEALREAGFETFVYTNQSTAVMENLHAFAKEGCKMQGLCTITRHEDRWGEEEAYEVMGIRFSLS